MGHLDLAQISYVKDLQCDEDKNLTIKRAVEDGYYLLEVKMPCLVTVLTEANKPRYMSVKGIVEAYDKEVEVWDTTNITVDLEKLGLKGSPTKVRKSFTKGAKQAGKIHEVEPKEAAKIIV